MSIALPTFEEWLKRNHEWLSRSRYVKYPGFSSLYVRKGYRDSQGDVVIANITARFPGNGTLTSFLERWEPELDFSFEQVINPRLEGYLSRRGYSKVRESFGSTDWRGYTKLLVP